MRIYVSIIVCVNGVWVGSAWSSCFARRFAVGYELSIIIIIIILLCLEVYLIHGYSAVKKNQKNLYNYLDLNKLIVSVSCGGGKQKEDIL